MGNNVYRVAAIFLAAFLATVFASNAYSKCEVPKNSPLQVAAKINFDCSSTRDLKELPEGESEFVASYNFPKNLPNFEPPWNGINFRQEPERYARALLAYGLAGNEVLDWRIDAKNSDWCHAPWWHYKRERIHGMTKERRSRIFELAGQQTKSAENWAVGFYNNVGCYALGRVWENPASPKTKDFVFPDGAYSIKLLFTTTDNSQVPYLKNSKSWKAAIGPGGDIVSMNLLQVDVAVKTKFEDGTPTWVFGTFIFDDRTHGKDIWEKLVPVGLMWGNDPTITMKKFEEEGGKIEESWINPAVANMFYPLPRHHLGLFGRLNGPVDNPKSACLACHGRALDWGRGIPTQGPIFDQYNSLLPLAINPTDEEKLKSYFRNLRSNEPFVQGTQSLDYSLQLAGGLSSFRLWVDTFYLSEANLTRDVPPYAFKGESNGVAAKSQLDMNARQDREFLFEQNLFTR